jgi:mannose-6-phosphate isomerase-like protein (cupin superfamily)
MEVLMPDSFHLIKPNTMTLIKVNIEEKLSLIHDLWKPRIVGELNQQQIRLVKIKGEFVMHKHDHEDELFLVIKGLLKIEYEDKWIELDEGEFIIIPKGVKHRPIANEEVHLLLFEPATILNTGDVRNELTLDAPERI